MRFVSYPERRSTLHVMTHIPFVTWSLRVWRGIHLCILLPPLADNGVSHVCNSRGSPFWARGVIAWGHAARMAGLKHVNQGGKLLNLCGGVRKMLLKKHGFAFSVMPGVRNLWAWTLRRNQSRVCLLRLEKWAVHENRGKKNHIKQLG